MRKTLSVVLILLICGIANAQLAFTSLHPTGADDSSVKFIDEHSIGGSVYLSGKTYATLWVRDGERHFNTYYLNPPNVDSAEIVSAYGNQQVGTASVTRQPAHAALWNSDIGSFVDLQPSGAFSSYAYATNGTLQVGSVNMTGDAYHACTWMGSVDTFRDINPTGAYESWALGICEQKIVGIATIGSGIHAILWNGDKITDLNPRNISDSAANATTSTTQIGWTGNYFYGNQHAAIWHGSPNTYMDLHPAGHENQMSWAVAGFKNLQVGQLNGQPALWAGSPDTYINLQPYLPAALTNSAAWSIYTDNSGTCYIVGNSYNTELNRTEAWLLTGHLVWTQRKTPDNKR